MLAGRRVSIVDATPGVTRDRVSVYVDIETDDAKRCVEVVDTGGHGVEDAQQLTAEVESQIAHGVAEADLILFVVDVQTGMTPLDHKVAQLLREHAGKTPALLVANKVDSQKHEPAANDAYELGFGEPVVISATSSHRKREFLERIMSLLPEPGEEQSVDRPDEGVLLAIAGKRNAGKSTLVNALAGAERVIVSEVEGTTRDAVDVRIEVGDKVFTAIDTAGVRKRKSLDGDIEFYSHHRSLRSIRRAHVVLLLIDATVPVSQVDKQLSIELQRHFKPTVVVVNKWDLAQEEHEQEEYVTYLDDALKGLSYAPIVFTSALDNEGVDELLAMAWNLNEQAGHRVTTGELNRVVEQVVAHRAPPHKRGKRAKVYYATQLDVHPPTIALFVNDAELFDSNYQRYLINRFRDELPYSEVPIKLVIRGKAHAPAEAVG